MSRIGSHENLVAGIDHLLGAAVVDHLRRQHGDSGMMVLSGLPAEEILAKSTRVLNGAEAVGEIRAILQGLELGLLVRVIVAHVGPAMGLGNPKIREQVGHQFGGHCSAAVGVEF